MRVTCIGWFLVCLAKIAIAGDGTFLCVAEKATGFHYNKKSNSWETANFRADSKYILRRPNEDEADLGDDTYWVVLDVGDSYPSFVCKNDINDAGNLWCDTPISGEFRFSRSMLRFMRYFPGQYVHSGPEDDDNPDTPFLEIGRCTTL